MPFVLKVEVLRSKWIRPNQAAIGYCPDALFEETSHPPEDAYRCFMGTEMDVLVLGNRVLLKDEQH